MKEVWNELGIEPTCSRKEIKKAYAQKLKIKSPEKNPDGFQKLHRAYEFALAYAAGADRSAYPTGNSVNMPVGQMDSTDDSPELPLSIFAGGVNLSRGSAYIHKHPSATAAQYVDELFQVLDEEGEESATAFFRYMTESEEICDARIFGRIESILYERIHNWNDTPKPKELFYVICDHYDWIGNAHAATVAPPQSSGFKFSYAIAGFFLLSILRACGNSL